MKEKKAKGKILVTGNAGFIGMHTALRLAKEGYHVIGLDNLNTYYSVELKLARLRQQGIETDKIQYGSELTGNQNISFIQLDITDDHHLEMLFEQKQFDFVIHLAAQAGVRYSIENPHAYVDSNVKGFLNILEACRKYEVKHLIYASSSSVYGQNEKVPFEEDDRTDKPVSLYAATKKADELIAHSYAAVHNLSVIGLRFFTVYGPWGRPDMALFKFTKNMLGDKPIDLYNEGNLSRDFTYIDDIVEGILRVVNRIGTDTSKHNHIFNIGRGEPVRLMDFVDALEQALDKKARINKMPMQPGDVFSTHASTAELQAFANYAPKVSLQEGVKKFVEWYREYFGRLEVIDHRP